MGFEDIKEKGARTAKWGKEIDQLVADRLKPTKLVREHLMPCGDDVVLITLKGHLLIENLLEMNLCRLLGIDGLPPYDDKTNPKLEFSQKLKMVQAVASAREPVARPNADLFWVIGKLNKARNDLAHRLMNREETECIVKSFLQSYHSKADTKLNSKKALPEQLRSCIIRLSKFLDEVRVETYRLTLGDQ